MRRQPKSLMILFICSLLFFQTFQAYPVLAAGTDVVTFPDTNLEKAIRKQLNKPSGDITVLDMESLRALDARNFNITDLTGIEKATYLISLELSKNRISAIDPLKGLTYLDHVNLAFNQVESISALSPLKYLKSLYLTGNQIQDLSPIQNLTYLQYLEVSRNNISDTTALTNLTNLKSLSVAHNQIKNITITNMRNLESFYAYNNQLTTLDLSGTPNIRELYVGNNKMTTIDLTPIKQPKEKGSGTRIDLKNNLLTTIDTTNFWYLSELNLSGNQLRSIDFSGISGTDSLTLHLNNNKLEEVKTGGSLYYLSYLDLSHNQLTSFSLGYSYTNHGLTINASYNPLTAMDLSSLSLNPYYGGGSYLDLSHTELSDLSQLKLSPEARVENLYLSNNNIESLDFSSMDSAALAKIRNLDISHNALSSLNISLLSNLNTLTAAHNQFHHLNDIEGLFTNDIYQLDLANNPIADISDLLLMRQLRSLNLSGTKVEDIFSLGLLTNLWDLDLSHTNVPDLSPLNGLTALSTLNVENTLISDLSPLNYSTNLNTLNISNTKVTTLDSLTNTKITTLKAANNNITNMDKLRDFTQLSYLDLAGNKLENVDALQTVNLYYLNLEGNNLTDGSSLARLTNLSNLNLSGNKIDNLSFLEDLANLYEINVANNMITDLTPLRNNIESSQPYVEYWAFSPYDYDATGRKNVNISNNPINMASNAEHVDVLKELSNLVLYVTKPFVYQIGEHDDHVSGYVDPASTITVMIAEETFTGTALADGSFTVEIPMQTAGVEIEVTATAADGTVSEPTIVVVRDLIAPAIPVVDEVTDADTTVTGKTEAGAQVQVKVSNSVIGSSEADDDGQFSVIIPVQRAGTKLVVTAADAAGNTSEPVRIVVKDKTGPIKPTANAVNDTDRNVYGRTEYGATVEVTSAGVVLGSAKAVQTSGYDSYGYYSIDIPLLAAGTELEITAYDAVGNASEALKVVVQDVTAPALTLVNEVTDQDTVVTGTAEAGATISVKAVTNEIGSGVAGQNGAFSVTIPRQKAGVSLSIIATDSAGNNSWSVYKTVMDRTPPATPTVWEIPSDQYYYVSGSAELNTRVVVKAGERVVGEGYPNSSGNFKITISPVNAGTELIVTAIDWSGNVSAPLTIVVRDNTAPLPPKVSKVTDQDTMVTGIAEAGSKVSVRVPAGELGSTTVSDDGSFSVDIPVQTVGTKLTVSSTDKSGNSSYTEVVVTDGTPPEKPVVHPVTDVDTTITGEAERYSRVELWIDGVSQSYTSADYRGRFTFNISLMKEGTVFTVTATDQLGNTSEATTVTVTDGTPPEVPVVDDVTDLDTTISGKTDPGVRVEARFKGSMIGFTTSGDDGYFSIGIPEQAGGTELTVVSIDNVGNESAPTYVTVKDVTTPEAPVVNPVNDQDKVVTGKTVAGLKVEVANSKGVVLGSGTAGADGTFSITIPVQQAGVLLFVHAISVKGNPGLWATTTVADVTPPGKPGVQEVTEKDTTVIVYSEPGVTIEIKVNGVVIGSADTKGEEEAVVEIPAQKAGTELIITATDKMGFVSEAVKVVVADAFAPAMPVVNAVTDKDTVVTGIAEPGATVVVIADGSQVGSAVADADGNFKVELRRLLQAGMTITVKAYDVAEHVSEAAKVIVEDATPPQKPEVGKVTAEDVALTGVTEAGATVTVVRDGGIFVGTTVASSDGKFFITINPQPAGSQLSVTAKDAAGNISEAAVVTVESAFTGWKHTDAWYYYISGKAVTGWQTVGRQWYYFNSTGAMQTGWLKSGSVWYYLQPSGEMAKGWVKVGTAWYYFQSSGAMQTGWLQDGGKWYFFESGGNMKTGWMQSGSTWYYFNSGGVMQTGWLYSGGAWYYFTNSGAMQTGSALISGKWYRFSSSGVLL
jgi:Leucine-rich repeat (LRR) protein